MILIRTYWSSRLSNLRSDCFCTENIIEQEINTIRLNIYEKIKDMTPRQLTEYYRKSGEASAQKYGFKLVESAKPNVTAAPYNR